MQDVADAEAGGRQNLFLESGSVTEEEFADIQSPEGGNIEVRIVDADTLIIVASIQGATITLEFNRIAPIAGG